MAAKAKAVWRVIAAFAGKNGKAAAINKFGKEAVESAAKSARRNKNIVQGKRAKNPKGRKGAAVRTPTRTVRAPKKVPPKTPRAAVREQTASGMRARPDEAVTTRIGTVAKGTPSAAKKKQISRRNIRDAISAQEGETRAQNAARIRQEARAGGVQTGEGFRAERFAKPLHDLETGQANRALRGLEGDLESTPDLVDMLKGVRERKKGGKVGSPKGVGKALRGYGRAMKRGK